MVSPQPTTPLSMVSLQIWTMRQWGSQYCIWLLVWAVKGTSRWVSSTFEIFMAAIIQEREEWRYEPWCFSDCAETTASAT